MRVAKRLAKTVFVTALVTLLSVHVRGEDAATMTALGFAAWLVFVTAVVYIVLQQLGE